MAAAAPPPAPPLKQQQQCEKRKKTIATNASKDNIFTAGIHPAPSMSSRERLVQLVERNVQDARFSEDDAVEKKTMKKKSSLQRQQQQQQQQPVNRHGRNNSQRPLNPAFIKKANSDVDIVKTPLPLKKPLTKTTTTVPKAGRKLVKAAATRTTENKKKWVEEIEPGVFLTFTKLDALRTTVTRVQFARRVFENDAQGLKWWQENRARIFRDRNLAAPTK
jgi:hypothetical protein